MSGYELGKDVQQILARLDQIESRLNTSALARVYTEASPPTFTGTHFGLFDGHMHIYFLNVIGKPEDDGYDKNKYEGELVLVQFPGNNFGRRSPIKATFVNDSALIVSRTLGGSDLTVTLSNFRTLTLGGTEYFVGVSGSNSIHVKK